MIKIKSRPTEKCQYQWLPSLINLSTPCHTVNIIYKKGTNNSSGHFFEICFVILCLQEAEIKKMAKLGNKQVDNKQLLDEVEHDIMNYQKRGLCYLPKPKAEADEIV